MNKLTTIIKDFPNYTISTDGVITNQYGKVLKSFNNKVDGTGYNFVQLVNGIIKQKLYVHRLVALTFIVNKEDKPQVNHKDGNKLNNTLENLEWMTASENCQHAFDTGLRDATRGSKHKLAKLTETDIPEIRIRLRSGETQVSIAKAYGVSSRAIRFIKTSGTWSHIK